MTSRLPILRTARLRLLRPALEDLDAVFAIHGDPETNRHNPDGAASFETSKRWLHAWTGDWEREGFGYFCVVRDDEPGHVIGIAGLKVAPIRMPDDVTITALNLYYRFRPAAWGSGLAREAAAAALAHVRPLRLDLPVCALIREDNLPSRRLAARLGLRDTGEPDAAGRRVHLL